MSYAWMFSYVYKKIIAYCALSLKHIIKPQCSEKSEFTHPLLGH